MTHLVDCKEICYGFVKNIFAEYMFENIIVQTRSHRFIINMYVINMVDVYRNQIESADSLNFYTHLVIKPNRAGQTVHQHVKDTKFAKEAEEKLSDQVSCSSNINGMSMGKGKCEKEIIVRFVQLYSLKSATSMKRASVAAYPFRVSLMNLS